MLAIPQIVHFRFFGIPSATPGPCELRRSWAYVNVTRFVADMVWPISSVADIVVSRREWYTIRTYWWCSYHHGRSESSSAHPDCHRAPRRVFPTWTCPWLQSQKRQRTGRMFPPFHPVKSRTIDQMKQPYMCNIFNNNNSNNNNNNNNNGKASV